MRSQFALKVSDFCQRLQGSLIYEILPRKATVSPIRWGSRESPEITSPSANREYLLWSSIGLIDCNQLKFDSNWLVKGLLNHKKWFTIRTRKANWIPNLNYAHYGLASGGVCTIWQHRADGWRKISILCSRFAEAAILAVRLWKSVLKKREQQNREWARRSSRNSTVRTRPANMASLRKMTSALRSVIRSLMAKAKTSTWTTR